MGDDPEDHRIVFMTVVSKCQTAVVDQPLLTISQFISCHLVRQLGYVHYLLSSIAGREIIGISR
jgi:hypothetical protein